MLNLTFRQSTFLHNSNTFLTRIREAKVSVETRFKELPLSVEDSIRHRTIQKTVLLQATSKHLGRPSLAAVSVEVETLAAVRIKNSTVTIFESVISNQSADSNRSFVDFLSHQRCQIFTARSRSRFHRRTRTL